MDESTTIITNQSTVETTIPIVEGESAITNPISNTQETTQPQVETKPEELSTEKTEHVDKGGGQPGNINKMKWKTQEERVKACEDLCKELEQGYPKEYLKIADWDTIERYMRDFPLDFPTEKIHGAIRIGIRKIIGTGYAGMTGKVPGFQSRTWEFITQNMTHWKLRRDDTSGDKPITPMGIKLIGEDNASSSTS